MEQIFKIGLYVALGLVQLCIFGMLYCKYMEAKYSRIAIDDLEAELDETIKCHKDQKEYLLNQIEEWKRKAVTPLEDFPTPVIFDRKEIKHWVGRTHIETIRGTDKIRPGAVEAATWEFLESLKPFIYFELVRENGRVEYFQEIYVAKPDKLHYEKS